MAKIEGVCKEVIEKSEWIAIVTAGPDGPHVVATWGDYVRALGIRDDTLLVPVGGMHKTEANLNRDPRVELLCGTRQVQGVHGPGKGCAIVGRAEMQTVGPNFAAVKATFPWARAALVVTAE
ncbi:MAG: pyridoxamine 5'-phosphate oxidase family protein, partial [Sulfuricaulis sp.]|nr:pyridoxamine 5'-phosphate oxidase family protein [Sulfuricaulis sp.]